MHNLRKTHFTIPDASQDLPFTGERFIPGIEGSLRTEHLHRYLYALPFVVDRAILDIACGEGYGSFLLSQAAQSVLGVDIAEDVIQHANASYGTQHLSFRQGDALHIPVQNATFDVVVSFETIEHLTDPQKFLSEIRRVLKDDGILIISTPDALATDGNLHAENPYHFKELTKGDFIDLLSQSFPHITLTEQRFLHGSIILNRSSSAKDESLEIYETNNGTLFDRTSGSIKGSYLIAIAGPTPMPITAVSLMSERHALQKLEDDFRYAVSTMHHLEGQIAQQNEAMSELTTLRSEIQLLLQSVGEDGDVDVDQAFADKDIAKVFARIHAADVARKLAHAQSTYLRRLLHEKDS